MIINEKLKKSLSEIWRLVTQKYSVPQGNCENISQYVKELNDNEGQVREVDILIFQQSGNYIASTREHVVYQGTDGRVYDFSAGQYANINYCVYIKVPGTSWYYSGGGSKEEIPSSKAIEAIKKLGSDIRNFNLDSLKSELGSNKWLLTF